MRSGLAITTCLTSSSPDGKPVRPWLTAWMDAMSGCFVGWAITLNPDSDTIAESLVRGIGHTAGSPFFGAPLMLYIDNGKQCCLTMRAEPVESEVHRETS